MTPTDGDIFFSAYADADKGTHLWRSDGTEAGTVWIAQVSPADIVGGLGVAKNSIFLAALDKTHGMGHGRQVCRVNHVHSICRWSCVGTPARSVDEAMKRTGKLSPIPSKVCQFDNPARRYGARVSGGDLVVVADLSGFGYCRNDGVNDRGLLVQMTS
jgi:ELWxxDGT repeat protein